MTDMKIVAYRLYPNDSRVRISAGERDRRDETGSIEDPNHHRTAFLAPVD